MLKCEYHKIDLLHEILLPVLESDSKRYSKSIGQINKMLATPSDCVNNLEILQKHTGFASIPLPSKECKK